jgi:putative transposase
MPRASRIVLSAVPLHLIQRGHDRRRCFFVDEDFEIYRRWLHEQALLARCRVHAYVLMSNHVHSQYFNKRNRTTGAVWDGRYKSCLVQTEGYFLTCQRYIELNPVRAGMVRFPGNYKWSSYRSNAEGRHDGIVTPHSMYERLGATPSERRQAYCRLFQEALTPLQIDQIRAASNRGGVLGDRQFIAKIKPTPQP